MSSLAERLRIRSGRKPLYNDDESDEDMDIFRGGSGPTGKKPDKIQRADAKDDLCHACRESGKLLRCNTCTYAYHLQCLLPPLKIAPVGSWSCPECVTPLNDIDRILDCQMRQTDENEPSKQKFVKQYLVKWKGLSYIHCSWVPEKEFLKVFKAYPRLRTKVNNFHRQMASTTSTEEDWVAIRPEWTSVDRILASRRNGDEREYFVKWKDLPYDECYWEVESDISAFQPQIERFNLIQSRAHKKSIKKFKSSNRDGKESKQKQKEFQQYEQSPEFLSGGTLHPYQLEGLNFLRYSWSKHTHVILADEMGLGKTIQSIAFLASLLEEKISPYLVIAPLSTLRNWEREFATWAPQINVVMYVGSSNARSIIRQYEFFLPKVKSKKHKKKKKAITVTKESKLDRIKFDVLLTSYEMVNLDTTSLKPIKWECMIVDEGHRLKNKDSKLFHSLKLYSTNHRVLLTGTPLQNNLDELFMLMHFLDAGKFASLEEFQEEFKDINQEEQIVRLHKMLAPHLLRRVKKDVMKDLPPKKELILRVELSSMQKEYYKAILTRNYQILTRRGGAQISLINVVMELRKLCCHAYMLEGVEPNTADLDEAEAYRQLLDSSGKLQLLDKLMVKLKEQGHRVLIYSQFRHMLDLLEDYLTNKKWSYERIDGMISGVERQIRIDRFNAKNSTRFCFLLSTRAGGLGINLATADTVVIYDSDWNPHADLQAMARAHRLGQTNKVMIYRLVTRSTIEERMMQMTKKKMVLEHLVVGRLKTQMLNQEELDDIIRYGSKELFADENDEAGKARQIHYDDAAIDRLLDREQISEEALMDDDEEDGFLKAFKVANFEYIDEVEAEAAREEEARKQAAMNKPAASASERANYWDELLRDRYEEHQVEEFTALGKGKRSRKQMVAAEEDDLAGLEDVSSEGEEDNNEAEWIDTEMVSSGIVSGRKANVSKKKARVDIMEPLPLMEGEGKSFRVLGFTQNQRATFVQILMRFGLGEFDWSEFIPRMKQKSLEEIKEYGILFLTHIAEDLTDSPSFSDGVPKEGLRIHDVLVRVAILHLIRDKVKLWSEKPGIPLFAEDILSRFPGLRSGRFWKEEHDFSLLKAVLKHGYGRWQAVVEDKDLGFQDIIRQEQNLPSVNSSVIGGAQWQDGANFGNRENDGTVGGIWRGTSGDGSGAVGDTGVVGGLEFAKGNHLHQDGFALSETVHLREVQRRLVEFIKKRVILLEKVLNAEYQKEFFGEIKASDPANEELEVEIKLHDLPSPNYLEADFQTDNPSPILEPIAPHELLMVTYDNKPERMEMVRLYNELCKIINDNIPDSVQTYMGNKSAALRLRKHLRPLEAIHDDMQRILSVRPKASTTAGEKNMDVNRSMQPEARFNFTSPGTCSTDHVEDLKATVTEELSPKSPKTDSDKQAPATPNLSELEPEPLPNLESDKQTTATPASEEPPLTCLSGGKDDVEMRERTDDADMLRGSSTTARVIVLDD